MSKTQEILIHFCQKYYSHRNKGLLAKEISVDKAMHNMLITTYGLKHNVYSTFSDQMIPMDASFDC